MFFKKFDSNRNEKNKKKTKVKMNYLGMPVLDISKTLNVWFLVCLRENQNINGVALNGGALKTEQNYVKWILTAFLFILKLKMFIKTLLMMFKNGLTHLILMEMIKDGFQ